MSFSTFLQFGLGLKGNYPKQTTNLGGSPLGQTVQNVTPPLSIEPSIIAFVFAIQDLVTVLGSSIAANCFPEKKQKAGEKTEANATPRCLGPIPGPGSACLPRVSRASRSPEALAQLLQQPRGLAVELLRALLRQTRAATEQQNDQSTKQAATQQVAWLVGWLVACLLAWLLAYFVGYCVGWSWHM